MYVREGEGQRTLARPVARNGNKVPLVRLEHFEARNGEVHVDFADDHRPASLRSSFSVFQKSLRSSIDDCLRHLGCFSIIAFSEFHLRLD